jgi:mannosyltransferase
VSRYAQEARPYAIAMLLSVVAAILFMRAIDQPTWPRWLTYGACMVGLGLAHLVALSTLVAHALAVRFTASVTGRLRVWRWLGALVLVAAAAGPFVLAASGSSDAVSWIRIDQPTLRAFPAGLFGSAVVAALVVAFAVIGIYARLRGPEPHVTLLASWALAPPVLTFLTFPILGLFHFRYLLFTVPAWVVLAAAGIDALAARTRARRELLRALIAGAAVAAIGLAGLPGQVSARHDPVLGYPDYRGAAGIIRSDLRIGDAIAFGGIHFRARRAMTYENRRTLRPRDVFLYEPAERLGGYVATECPDPAACLGGTARIWLVNTTLSPDYFAELSPAIGDLLRSRCTVVRTWHLDHLYLVLLRVDGAASPPG